MFAEPFVESLQPVEFVLRPGPTLVRRYNFRRNTVERHPESRGVCWLIPKITRRQAVSLLPSPVVSFSWIDGRLIRNRVPYRLCMLLFSSARYLWTVWSRASSLAENAAALSARFSSSRAASSSLMYNGVGVEVLDGPRCHTRAPSFFGPESICDLILSRRSFLVFSFCLNEVNCISCSH